MSHIYGATLFQRYIVFDHQEHETLGFERDSSNRVRSNPTFRSLRIRFIFSIYLWLKMACCDL